MTPLEQISQSLQQGQAKNVQQLVRQVLAEGYTPNVILKEGLMAGMSVISAKFKANEIYVPDVLIASRAMNVGIDVLKPHLVERDLKPLGKVVLGTVEGDLHDIGKNLVKIMMQGVGFEVIDLGVDVSAEKFVSKIKEEQPTIVAISALLTTTMSNMETVIKAIEKEGLREQVTIIVGGAPVNANFAELIGADIYTADAASAADAARKVVTH